MASGGAVDVLVDGAAADARKAGDDEAGVDALRAGLDAGDDAFDPVPTGGAVVELLEAARLAACRSGARRRAGLQRGGVPAQRGRRRDAEDIVEPVLSALAPHRP